MASHRMVGKRPLGDGSQKEQRPLISPMESIFKNDILERTKYFSLHCVHRERRWARAPLSLQGLDSRKAPDVNGLFPSRLT